MSVDRSQWFLDVSPEPGANPLQFDLLVAAQRGQPYEECYPELGTPRPLVASLPKQIPELSWREALPEVLRWIAETDVAGPVALAQDQRFVVSWPDSPTAKKIRRNWRAQNRHENG